MKETILENYKKNKKTYHDFRERIVHLLTDLLIAQDIIIHQISSRTKALDSLSKKIDDKNGKYNAIEDITDIIGIRIIAYLESDVDSIADLIDKEFIKDDENSTDKRILKADQFGYRSLHIVVSFNDERCKLKEYKRYKGIKCEIQIRSILQHAWAEIEHDLGYKGVLSVPEEYKRTFNRLSALLETADVEFDRLKYELKKYEKEVPSLIKSEPESVDINMASINSFVDTNEVLLKAKELIELKVNGKLGDLYGTELVINLANYFKLESIKAFDAVISAEEENYLKFIKLFLVDFPKLVPGKIAPLLFFLHYLAAKTQSEEKALEYEGFFGNNGNGIVKKYKEFYKEIVSQ